MKKMLYLFLAVVFILLSSCHDDIVIKDDISPLIIIEGIFQKVTINVGDEIDLMQGVKGYDNIDGTITHLIVVDDVDFNPLVPGVYTIYYYLADKSGNQANYQTKEVTVINPQMIIDYPIYRDIIDNEVYPDPANCFPGAWYYKAVSSFDYWVGIVGTITLPSFTPDPNRDSGARYLDNPSVYMGGNASFESDAGLSFSLVTLNNNTSISSYSMAYRPFWRYITKVNQDEGGYNKHDGKYSVTCTNNNCYANWFYGDSEFYYLPGDKVKMTVFSPKANYLQLMIEILEISKLPESILLRATHGWNEPANFISPLFYSANHGLSQAEFKRVNAIDQVANEGKPAIMTYATVVNANWESTYLLRKFNQVIMRVPFIDERRFVLACPYVLAFTITKTTEQINNGGETITIKPKKDE